MARAWALILVLLAAVLPGLSTARPAADVDGVRIRAADKEPGQWVRHDSRELGMTFWLAAR